MTWLEIRDAALYALSFILGFLAFELWRQRRRNRNGGF